MIEVNSAFGRGLQSENNMGVTVYGTNLESVVLYPFLWLLPGKYRYL